MTHLVRAGTRRVSAILPSVLATLFEPAAASAQETPTSAVTGAPTRAPGVTSLTSEGGVSFDLDVVARQLDIARSEIQPSLGATVYDFGRQAIETQPQGDNQPFNRLLLQAPGVAQDSFGQLHVRGDHANLQFRLNGVQLPEGINVFGLALQTHVANSVPLITGARLDLAAVLRGRCFLRRGRVGCENYGQHGRKNRRDAPRPRAYQVRHQIPRVDRTPPQCYSARSGG